MRPIKPRLSVVLATYNEELNLARCLDSVKDLAGEIVVVDGSSKDETVRIAKKYTDRVFITSNKPIFHINKQMAIDKARSDWILQLDADEVVDKTLRESVMAVVKEGSAYEAFYLNRKNYFLGGFLTKGGQYPDRVIRFFKRGRAYLPQKDVHEQMVVEGEVGLIAGHLLHYNAPNFKRYITNANRYSSLRANEWKAKGVKLNLFNDLKYLMIKPLCVWFDLFVRHRGYVDGFRGFVFALFSGLHFALAYMKLGDLDRQKNENSN